MEWVTDCHVLTCTAPRDSNQEISQIGSTRIQYRLQRATFRIQNQNTRRHKPAHLKKKEIV